MIKKDIIETEVRSSGFKKFQDDIMLTNKNIEEYNDELKRLNYEKNKLIAAGKTETKAYREITKGITAVRKSLNQSKDALKEQERQLPLTALSYNQLKKKAGELTKELYNMSEAVDPVAFTKARGELKQYQDQMSKMQQGIKKTNASFKNQKPTVWANLKQLIPIASITAIGAKLTSVANQAIQTFARLDDKMADVQKTTQMSKAEVKALDAELMKINTRTSREELLDLARVAGKLGVAKNEVAGFVRSADQIRVALTEDLGGDVEESIRKIGKLADIFKIKETLGLEKSLQSIGSAINSLGAASTANEENIVDFTNRTAGIAPQAKVSIQNVMGLGAAIDILGQSAEVGGTTYSQVMTGMFKKTEQYAKVAGMSIKEFTDLLNRDANEAFIKFLEGAGSGGDMGGMTKKLAELKLEGTRSTQVLGALAGNVDLLRNQQALSNAEFAKANSLQEEANTKNASAQALIEKRKKDIDQVVAALGEKLMPLWSETLGLTAGFMTVLKTVIGTLIEYRGIIIAVATVTSAYIAVKKLHIFYSKANRAAIAVEAAGIIASNGATIAATLGAKALAAAKMLVTFQFRAAAIAAKAFFVSLGPIGWAITATTALAGVLMAVKAATKEASGAAADLALSLAQERATYEDLKKAVTDNAQGSVARAEAIRLINERYKEYLPNLITDKMSNEEIAAALTVVNQKMEENIKVKIKAQEMERIQKEQYEAEKKAINELVELYNHKGDKTSEQISIATTQFATLVQALSKTGDEIAFTKDAAKIFGKEITNIGFDYARKGTLHIVDGLDILEMRFQPVIESAKTFTAQMGILNALINVGTPKKTDNYATWNLGQLNTELSTLNTKLSLKNALTEEERKSEERRRGLIQEQIALRKQQIKADNTYAGVLSRLKAEKKSLDDDLDATDGSNKKEIARIQALIAAKQKEIDLYSNKKTSGSSGTKWSLSSDEAYLKAKAELREKQMKGDIDSEEEHSRLLLALEIKTLEDRIALNKEKGADFAKLEEQLLDKRYQQHKTVRDREKKLLEIAAQGDGVEDKENDAYEKQLWELSLFARELEEMTENEQAAYLQLKRAHYEKLSAIYVDQLSKEITGQQKAIQRKATALKQSHNDELATATTFEQKKQLLRKWYSTEELRRIKTDKQADEALKKGYANDEQNALKEDLSKMLSIYESMAREVGDTGLFANGVAATEEDKAKLLEIIDVLQKKLAELGAIPAPSLGGDVKDRKSTVDLLGMTAEDWERLHRNIEEGKFGLDEVVAIATAIGSAFSTVSNLMSSLEQREFKNFEKTQKKKKSLLDRQLKSGTISQERYNETTQKMDAETDAKREEIERKRAKRDKMLAVFQSLIQTAVAIAAALPNVPLSIAVGVLGAAATAAILATPLPGAEEGGMIGVEREQDGKRFNAEFSPRKRGYVHRPTVIQTGSGQPVITGEAGTEYVVPNHLLQVPQIASMVGLIEASRLSGTFRPVNLPAALATSVRMPGRASGGYAGDDPLGAAMIAGGQVSASSAFDDGVLRELKEVVGKLSRQLEKPLPVAVSAYGRDGIVTIQKKIEQQQRRAGIGGGKR